VRLSKRSCGLTEKLGTASTLHVKPEDAARLTPAGILMVRKYSTPQVRAKKYAKEKQESMSSGKLLVSD
jgi:hypothetical protein